MNYIPPRNSTNQSDDNKGNLFPLISSLVTLGIIFSIVFIFLFYRCIKSRRHHRQPQRDVEAAKAKPKETIDLQTLSDANPSQKYTEVKELTRQATSASTQSGSAEVCAVCIEVLVDDDDVRRLKCNHVFHMSCIDSWFQKHHVDCPLCRSIFIPDRQGDSRPEEVR